MTREQADGEGQSWSGLDGIDKSLEHRTRLGICVLLSRSDRLTFSRLKELLEATDGALGAHLRKLEDSGYLVVHKEFQERKPVSWYSLTAAGGEALQRHLMALAKLIREHKPG